LRKPLGAPYENPGLESSPLLKEGPPPSGPKGFSEDPSPTLIGKPLLGLFETLKGEAFGPKFEISSKPKGEKPFKRRKYLMEPIAIDLGSIP